MITGGNEKLYCILMKKFEDKQYYKRTIQIRNSD